MRNNPDKIEHGESREEAISPRLPLGLKLLVAFFWFGAAMCLLALLALVFPEGVLAPIWRLKPDARSHFQSIGGYAFLLMPVVGLACAFSAIGLAKRAPWGQRLAISVLTVNLLGDAATALIRDDYRTLIGLPVGGAMIFYLWRMTPTYVMPKKVNPSCADKSTCARRARD